MKTLYIIGNGFDLFHGLDTHYGSFGLFLKKHHVSVYDQLMEYVGFPNIRDGVQGNSDCALWNAFEQDLSFLDPDTVYEDHSHSLANPGAESFRDRDWHAFAIDIQLVVENLTTKLFSAFNQFILNVNYPALKKNDLIHLDTSAFYLSFNYTNALEQYYSIPKSRILYIHGKAMDSDSNLILGHGIEPKIFKEDKPKPPLNASDEELEMWHEYMANQYDLSFEEGKQELYEYFLKTFKPTNKIISENTAFFKSIENVESVFILGHSLSDVDIPYLQKIADSFKADPAFTVSFYSSSEESSHRSTLMNLGVKEAMINMIKLDQLK